MDSPCDHKKIHCCTNQTRHTSAVACYAGSKPPPYNLSNTAYGKTAQSQKIGHKDEPNKIRAAVITGTIAS